MMNEKNIGKTFTLSRYWRWGSDDMFEIEEVKFKVVSADTVEVTNGSSFQNVKTGELNLAEARQGYRSLRAAFPYRS